MCRFYKIGSRGHKSIAILAQEKKLQGYLIRGSDDGPPLLIFS